MASTFSTNLAIELIGTGDQAGTWGTTTNSNLGTLIEQAISGYVTQAVATGTDTTITIPNGATGVARNMYIELTGTGGTNTNLIVPANKKLYFIFNNSTGAVTVKVSGQTGVSVPTGKKMVLVSNGTDIVNGLNYIADFGTNSFSVTNLTASSGTITNLIATSGSITNLVSSDASATVLRAGSATLTHLSATSASITNLSLTSLTISSLSITNVSVASATVSSNLTLSGGNLAFTSTAQRVTADMSNGTVSNRFAFQTSTTNGNTQVNAIPNGSATTSQFIAYNSSDPNNASSIQMAALSTTIRLLAGQTGTGTYLPITFFTNGSEQMRLDTSGNLGIGTASPLNKLGVVGSDPVLYLVNNKTAATNNVARLTLNPSSAFDNSTYYKLGPSIDGLLESTSTNASALVFSTYNGSALVERMRLDSSGNLGLGVTPSASWFASAKAIQIGIAGAPYMGLVQQTTTTCDGYMLWGARLSGDRAFQYTTTGDAVCAYRQNAGTHNWFTAGSGTAGNTISFTQAMTLDASGNLGIGTTTNALTHPLTLYASGSTFRYMAVGNSNTGLNGTLFGIDGSGNTVINNTQNLSMLFLTNNTERARITNGGDVGIGTASPGVKLDVVGAIRSSTTTSGSTVSATTDFRLNNATFSRVAIGDGGGGWLGGYSITYSGGAVYSDTGSISGIYYTNGGNIQFYAGGSAAGGTAAPERARILSTGEFLAGATSAISVAGVSGFHGLSADANNKWAAVVRNTTSSTPFGLAINYSAAAPNNTSSNFIYCYDSGALRASIRANGGLANYQANNVDLSDARTKKDITPVASMWGKVAALEIVAYKYNDQTHDDVNLGVIAQQVESVEPVWVDADGFGDTPEDGVPLKTVYTKDITFAAIKALQEAMARIETLEAKVTALESK